MLRCRGLMLLSDGSLCGLRRCVWCDTSPGNGTFFFVADSADSLVAGKDVIRSDSP